MTHVTGLGDLLWLVQDPQFSILLIFFENFRKSIKNSQEFVFFVQTRVKINAWFLKFFEKYAKIVHFLPVSSENFFAKFQKFSGVRGAPPPGPHTRPAKTLNPLRNFFLRTPLTGISVPHPKLKY